MPIRWEEMKEVPRCDKCRHWSEAVLAFDETITYCDRIDQNEVPGTDEASIHVEVADDHNLYVRLRTGPAFGCTLFKEKQ